MKSINELTIRELKEYFNKNMKVKNLKTGRMVKMSTHCWIRDEYIMALKKQNRVEDCIRFIDMRNNLKKEGKRE